MDKRTFRLKKVVPEGDRFNIILRFAQMNLVFGKKQGVYHSFNNMINITKTTDILQLVINNNDLPLQRLKLHE